MAKPAQGIPKGFHTVTPGLTIKGAEAALAFYKKAFGAEVISSLPGPDGKTVMHAELRIGDSVIFLADEFPDMGYVSPKTLGGTACTLHLYVTDVDAAFKRAVDAGATVAMPPADMFWGDRYGKVDDPFGHRWGIATKQREMSEDEIRAGGEKFFAEMEKGKGKG